MYVFYMLHRPKFFKPIKETEGKDQLQDGWKARGLLPSGHRHFQNFLVEKEVLSNKRDERSG
jgi:hypothetical protein